MSGDGNFVIEEQFHRLLALERLYRIAKFGDGLRDIFDHLLDGVEAMMARKKRVFPEPQRTYWSLYTYDAAGNISGTEARGSQAKNPADNFLVSSLCESGLHAPCLDLDFMVCDKKEEDNAVTSILFRPPHVGYKSYSDLLRVLADAGIVEHQDVEETMLWYHRLIPISDSINVDMPVVISRVPTRLLPSSTIGHFHLYFDVEMPWETYRQVLMAFNAAGFLNPKWFEMAMSNRMSRLIRPGWTKTKVAERLPRKPEVQRRAQYNYSS